MVCIGVSLHADLRLACLVLGSLQGGDELLGTEMLFAGIFAELEPEECVAVLSALVFQEKVDDEPALAGKGRLLETRVQVDTLARDLAVLQVTGALCLPRQLWQLTAALMLRGCRAHGAPSHTRCWRRTLSCFVSLGSRTPVTS